MSFHPFYFLNSCNVSSLSLWHQEHIPSKGRGHLFLVKFNNLFLRRTLRPGSAPLPMSLNPLHSNREAPRTASERLPALPSRGLGVRGPPRLQTPLGAPQSLQSTLAQPHHQVIILHPLKFYSVSW